MESNGQQDAQHHVMDQQQSGWYGAPPIAYHRQLQQPQHPPQAFKWPGYDSSMQYVQSPVQPYGQPDYYMQQQHHHHHHQQQQHYPPPLPQQTTLQQPVQQESQHYLFNQQEQVWPSNNGWSQPQWNHHGTSTTGSEEEDWAAKARAWAAGKAAQEAAQQSQQQSQSQVQRHGQAQVQPQAVSVQQEQSYQDYPQQIPQAVQHPPEAAQHSSIQPPGQEVQHVFAHDSTASYRQDGHSYPQEPPVAFVHADLHSSFGQDGAPPAYAQTAHAQVVSSSYSQDVSNYGQDSAIAAPPGTVPHDNSSQKSISLGQGVSQPQQPQVPGQTLSHSTSQQHLLEDSAPSPPTFEFHQVQHFDYQQPPPPPPPPPQDFQQPASVGYLPPVPSMGMDTSEMNFGGNPNSMSAWPMGQPLVFPPSVGPGGPSGHPGSQVPNMHGLTQFDLPHHQHHSQPLHGHQQPHIFPRQHGPPHGPGFRPPGPPVGSGPFGFGGNPPLGRGGGVGPVFLQDGNGTLGPPDRPKKASVPSWLREEILKKKSAVGINSAAPLPVAEDTARTNGNELAVSATHSLLIERTRSDSSDMSDNEEDEEDDKELARTAAMNQEIKRILTEVLLKVTDDLFEEIAQEVIDEDELKGEEHGSVAHVSGRTEKLQSPSPPSPPAAPVLLPPSRVLVAPVKENTTSDDDSSEAPIRNVLGLATYASDDEDGERGVRPGSTSVMKAGSTLEEEKADDEVHDSKSSGSLKDTKDEKKVPPESHRSKLQVEGKETPDEVADDDKDGKSINPRRQAEIDMDRSSIKDRHLKSREKDPVDGPRLASKGKKRSNEDTNSSDQDTRSPRRPRHNNAERNLADKDSSGKIKAGTEISGRPNKTGLGHHESLNLKDETKRPPATRNEPKGATNDASASVEPAQQESSSPASVREPKDAKHAKASKDGTDGIKTARMRSESTDTLVKKGRDNEDGSKDHDLSKHAGTRHGDKTKVEKTDRSKEKERSRNKERATTTDKAHEKEKGRHERGQDRDRLRNDKGKDRGHAHDREGRKTADRDRRKEQTLQRRGRRRSSSSSSRDRSRSRSPSWSPGSSSESETRRKQRRQSTRRSRRRSVSLSPVRSRRRRPSRSRSRSPPSKYSHRRHSPSPSRENERRR